jgi:hypothetical protein
MTASRFFSNKEPTYTHLSHGKAISDLRTDVEAAFVEQQEVAGITGNVVIWAPYMDPDPNHVTTWEEAVAAVAKLGAPMTFIQILVEDGQDVYIPPGTWQLNNTTLVGKTFGASLDTSYNYGYHRGYQDLVYVEAQSSSTKACRLLGCVGLKDIYFRGDWNPPQTELTASFTAPAPGDTAVATVISTEAFSEQQLVYLDGEGYYRVINVNSATELTLLNLDYAGNSGEGHVVGSGASLYANNAVFYVNDTYVDGTTFTLDNSDFRYGNYLFGSFHVDSDGGLFLNLINTASLRWYALRSDGYTMIQGDGSSAWLGSYAFFGEGLVDVTPGAGMIVRRNQGDIANWYFYQPYTPYAVDNGASWGGSDPESLQEAVDRLAAAVKALGGNP